MDRNFVKGMARGFALSAALSAAQGWAAEIFIEGADTPIPALTQEVTALHLRGVGAARVYALRIPASVRELNLSANNLMVLPEDLVPNGVKRLWLADNNLTALPGVVSGWGDLEYLNLDRNLLASLPDLSRTRLRWLRLNGNKLASLPSLPATLERLYLADNAFAEVPAKPAALRQLTLAGNPIASVPDDLGAGLEWLDLSRTKVTRLPDDLSAWRTLKVLNLARCPLTDAERGRIRAAFDPNRTVVLF